MQLLLSASQHQAHVVGGVEVCEAFTPHDLWCFIIANRQGAGRRPLGGAAMCCTKTQRKLLKLLWVTCAFSSTLVFLKWGSCFNREIIKMWEATKKLLLCSTEGFGQQFQTHSNPVSATLAWASYVAVMQRHLYHARYSVFIGVQTNNTAVPNCLTNILQRRVKSSCWPDDLTEIT